MRCLFRNEIWNSTKRIFLSVTHSVRCFLRNQFQYGYLGLIGQKYRQLEYRYRYGASSPDPYRLLHIDPKNVDYLLAPRFQSRICNWGTHVESGEWDSNQTDKSLVYSNNYEHRFQEPTLVAIDNWVFFRSICERIENGASWLDTNLYHWFRDNNVYRYRTEREIAQRLVFIDFLYDEMRSEGYKTQSELQRSRSMVTPPEFDEIMVNIGREGQIIFDDGRHRFAIARILEIDSVPVRVLVRHTGWQAVREEIANTTCKSELGTRARSHLGHPDLEDVIPEHWTVDEGRESRPLNR